VSVTGGKILGFYLGQVKPVHPIRRTPRPYAFRVFT
jgi:hypothetical protein